MKSTEDLTRDVLQRAAIIKEKQRAARRRTGVAVVAFALVVTLALGIWAIAPQFRKPETEPTSPADSTATQTPPEEAPQGVSIPREEIELPTPKGAMFSWAFAFLVGPDRTYIGYETSMDIAEAEQHDLLGAQIGTTSGSDEELYWVEHPEAYQNVFASNIGADCSVYTVNGYDPSFRVAVVKAYTGYNGPDHQEVSGEEVFILDCLNGITLYTGRDLYTDRLHLRERFASAKSQSHSDWDSGKQDFAPLDTVSEEQWNAFFDALDAAPFVETKMTGAEMLHAKGQKHLFFTQKDGLRGQLRLFADGYVSLNGSRFMVQPDPAAFKPIYDACR
jgi:hypothetical protein